MTRDEKRLKEADRCLSKENRAKVQVFSSILWTLFVGTGWTVGF